MKLFYHCFGGAHTSITCASIHLNYLPKDRIPKASEFKKIPYYDKMENKKLGTPIYMGRDELGWDVYVMGMKNGKDVVIPAIKSYINTYPVFRNEILFVNALVMLHPITSIGGFASRKLGLVPIGRPMTVWGIRRSYPLFVSLVSRVKDNLARK